MPKAWYAERAELKPWRHLPILGRMTLPLGASTLPTRSADLRSQRAPAAPPSAPASGTVQARWSTPPLARPTPDHLALVQALIEAGQLARAMELLDAVWHHDLHDEHCWYLRLWLVTAQGRVLEALELARVASGELPGSAAVSYLHAALEHSAGNPHAAMEAALRASAIIPGRAEPEAMLELILADTETRGGEALTTPAGIAASESPMNPVAVALAGLALLHPQGSRLSYRPSLPAVELPVPSNRQVRDDRGRIWLIAVATVVAALWAVRDPLLASAALAAVVAWLSRPPRSRRA